MKSGNETVSNSEAVWESLVPITAKFRPLALTALRLLIVSVLVSPGAIEVGLNAQLAGALPEQLKLMLPVNPDWLAAETLKVVESVPLGTVDVLVGDDSEKATPPVPASCTTCGLPAASSVMVTAPVRAPATVGVKVTSMVQSAPAATALPQVFVCAKSPVISMLVMAKAASPAFVSVMVSGVLVAATA